MALALALALAFRIEHGMVWPGSAWAWDDGTGMGTAGKVRLQVEKKVRFKVQAHQPSSTSPRHMPCQPLLLRQLLTSSLLDKCLISSNLNATSAIAAFAGG